jgi:murein DD-endopeptidase MepM/ murein hydrolase activator NlpD
VEVNGGLTVIDPLMDGITDEDRDFVAAEVAADERAYGALSFRSSAETPPLYSFFPVSGNLDRDIPLVNFVDLDRSPGILDWNCTGFTYDGHKGLDAVIRSFGEQMIGVPILAALDGVVLSARDGLFDMHTIPRNVRGNQVLIDHGFGRRVWYLHMKRGSVAVAKGQTVKAGQQIGMVGSSGRSNWPHLHFETRVNGLAYEPFAGPCRPSRFSLRYGPHGNVSTGIPARGTLAVHI